MKIVDISFFFSDRVKDFIIILAYDQKC